MPLILQRRIYRADLKANPRAIYIFGDNEARYGLGGQAAEMRGEPNSIGVATLTAPGTFWTEANIDHQCGVLDADLTPVLGLLRQGRFIIFPLDGIGTGLADLARRSPTTFAHLETRIDQLKLIGGL